MAPRFRDYHLLFDEQGDQIFAMTDPIAERVRKVGGSTLRSIAHIARLQRIDDNDAEYVLPSDMLAELREDNKALAERLRKAHNLCEEHRDIATASLIEVWIDETERRTWFLCEAGHCRDLGEPWLLRAFDRGPPRSILGIDARLALLVRRVRETAGGA